METTLNRTPQAEVPAEAAMVSEWLGCFERALAAQNGEQLASLLSDECHWRDMFAFTWNISPREGKQAIVKQLLDNQERLQAHAFAIAKDSIPPRRVKRLGVDVVEGIFSFETRISRCKGLVRLVPGENRAWVLVT